MVAFGYFFPKVLLFTFRQHHLLNPTTFHNNKKCTWESSFRYIFINKYIYLYSHILFSILILFFLHAIASIFPPLILKHLQCCYFRNANSHQYLDFNPSLYKSNTNAKDYLAENKLCFQICKNGYVFLCIL